jgi:DNA-binding CsgD family transcriptional regulator
MKIPIYLDYHATTPVDPRVLEVMLPYFSEQFGNAASKSHAFGWKAEEAVEEARAEVARLVGASAREIVWTSGATESDNLAIKGVAQFHGERGRHLVTCKTEHKAVLDSMHALERQGFEVTYLDVERDGRLDPSRVQAALRRRRYLTPLIAHGDIDALPRPAVHGSPLDQLTPREREVLHLLAEGKVMKEVAAVLGITPRTVAFHKYRMMENLGIRTTAELVRFAVRSGLI